MIRHLSERTRVYTQAKHVTDYIVSAGEELTVNGGPLKTLNSHIRNDRFASAWDLYFPPVYTR